MRQTIIIAAAFSFVASFANGQDRAELEQCINDGFANLTAQRSTNFTSPEYRVTCPSGDFVNFSCRRHNRNSTFTFDAPAGFRLEGVTFNVTSQTARTSIGQLQNNGSRASIPLQCGGHGCDRGERVWVAGNLRGRQVYQPTAQDASAITAACLDQIFD